MRVVLGVMFSTVALAAGCSVPGPGGAPGGIHDPHEAANRRTHAFNQRLDQRFFSSDGASYGTVVPDGVQRNVTNFADTFAVPRTMVNQILQGKPGPATRNALRFTINATLGFAGIADVASDLGLARDETDFGATLAVWGAPEGAYMMLPVLGPSTERDTAGRVVDLFTNPLSYILPTPERYSGAAASVLDKMGSRAKYADAVDSVLHDSADSYAQLRLIYLQNRRFELGEEAPGSEDIDPMALDTEGF